MMIRPLANQPIALPTRSARTTAEAASDRLESAPLPDHVPGEVLVKLKSGSGLSDFASDYGASVAERFKLGPTLQEGAEQWLRLSLPRKTSVEQALSQMSQDGRVARVEPNFTYELAAAPNDLHPDLWGLHNQGQTGGTAGADISAPEAWATVRGSNQADAPVIAVIDTGMDMSHPDLVNNLWTNPGEIPGNGIDDDGNGVVDDVHGYDAYNQHGNPVDEHFHGTHVSGTIGAEGNNNQGVVGVNWQARLMPIKIFAGSSPTTNAATILRGVAYATQMGARITSNSWGGGAYSQALFDAFASSPALHIAGAGNNGTDNDQRPFYPSSYDMPNMVAVAATDHNDQKARFSCYGAQTVHLAAPGVSILSTVPNNGYAAYNGTSMATPHVSGVAGLIATAYPQASNEDIKQRLLLSTDPVEAMQGRSTTGGRLNAARAVENDQVAPAAPNDLRAVESTPVSVTMQWTATGDDSWCGQAAAYRLRVSDQPIEDLQAARLIATARPSTTGTLERASIAVEPAAEARTLHVALEVLDNVGNASQVRFAQVEVPAAPPPPEPPNP